MKALYLECKSGAAGDMLASALIGLFENKEKVVKELNSIGIPKVQYNLKETSSCGIKGLHLSVLIDGVIEAHSDEEHEPHCDDHHDHDEYHHHHHHHHTIYDIEEIIESLNLSKDVKGDIREVYTLLAEAESKAHGEPVSEIHFHEVGQLDAVADITAVCYLIHKLDADKVVVSPVNVGSGMVKTHHGILPVPAPATAYLLTGMPSYSNGINSELCTPTGAALLKYFAFEFASQPLMTITGISYGMGSKEFSQLNAVRAIMGEIEEDNESVLELSCNLDDMTAEDIGFAMDRLIEEGALEVFSTPVTMKKTRPGILLTCLCREDKRDAIVNTLFSNTTTIGVREKTCSRYVLSREITKVDTAYGQVRVKRSFGYGVEREKLEYDDVAGIARRTGRSILDVKKEIEDQL